MSYLDRPRLTFFGQFTANPSTINNTPPNYGEPLPYNTDDQNQPPGYVAWNSYGRHNFSLDNCAVTNVVMDGQGDSDTLQGALVTTQYGVLVDLDTQQQGVSQIIGMQLTVSIGGGSVSGLFATTNFADMFVRINGASSNDAMSGDGKFAASYQSVLVNLCWNEGGSNFLKALKAASPSMLSIRFNVDAFHDGTTEGTFTSGRVAGTIGPYFDGEPTTFTNARFLRPLNAKSQFGSYNFAPAKYDAKRGVLTIDLGNAIPTTWPSGQWPTSAVPTVQVATLDFQGMGKGRNPQPTYTVNTLLTPAVTTSDAAYQTTAFVAELTVPESLQSTIGSTPLGVVSPDKKPVLVMAENPTGAYANAEEWVFRMNPGEIASTTLWANHFGTPAAGVEIPLVAYTAMIGGGGFPVQKPKNAVQFPATLRTRADGTATVLFQAGNPKNPRGPIDGQVYGFQWQWSEDVLRDPWAFFSVKAFDAVKIPDAPTWWDDVFPILRQYAYLYAAMRQIIEIDDYQQVVANLSAIIDRLTMPEGSPFYMPITRELSRDKLAILLKWAESPVEGTNPNPPPPLPWPPHVPPQPAQPKTA
ncbi:MAG TPA: hypothetical protein VI670_10325 [Thermoanaerobaculia bacterium]|jgi:hypothetical protein